MKVFQNILRMQYLLSLYKMTIEDLLRLINDGLKNPIKSEDVLCENIELNHLKRIDKVFGKGLMFYLDTTDPINTKDSSIFFRKNSFGTELNLGAKKVVNQIEDLKISLSAMAKLSEINMERMLPLFNGKQNPKIIAQTMRTDLFPQNHFFSKKEFLKSLISSFAKKNILVFEFVETWNKKEKANIDGFFLSPNVIVLKRQESLSREIFTLAHELGHYLLNQEEVENWDATFLANDNLTIIERWCNDFAYYFLIGDYATKIDGLPIASPVNDYHFDIIKTISEQTYLSRLALFTRLLYQKKISKSDYQNVKEEIDINYKKRKEEEKNQRELERQNGKQIGGSTPKPIISPLFQSTLQMAYYSGVINETKFCKMLNIQPDKMGGFL